MNKEIRVCKKHGITEFFFSKSENKWKCKKCSINNVSKRRREIKRILVITQMMESMIIKFF